MFNKLKSLFIIEEESGNKSASNNEDEEAVSGPEAEGKEVIMPKSVLSSSSGKVTPKFTDVLFKAMESNNLDGFDYLEYKTSLKSLEKMPMDEQTRFKSAFAMAQTMGATPDHLVKTANHYVKVLLDEEDKFGKALATQRSKQIGERENQIKQLDSLIKEKNQQIEELKAAIEKHNKEMQVMKKEISNAVVKVENTKNDFHASFNNLVGQIKKDIEKMETYLK